MAQNNKQFWVFGPGSDEPISKHSTYKEALKAAKESQEEDASSHSVVNTLTGDVWSSDWDNRAGATPWEKDGKLSAKELQELVGPESFEVPKIAIPNILVGKGDGIPNVLDHYSEETVAATEFFALSGKFQIPTLEYGYQGRFGNYDRMNYEDNNKARSYQIEGEISVEDGHYILFEKKEIEERLKQRSEKQAREMVPLMLAKAKPMTATEFLAARKFDITISDQKTGLELTFEGRSLEEFQALLAKGFKAIEFPKKLVMDIKDIIAAGGDLSSTLVKKSRIKI